MNPMKFIAFFSVKSQFSFIFLYFPWLSRFLWGTVVCQDFKYEVYGLGLVSFSSPIPFWKSMGKSENLPPNGGESKKKLGKCMKRYGKNRSENSPLRLFQRLWAKIIEMKMFTGANGWHRRVKPRLDPSLFGGTLTGTLTFSRTVEHDCVLYCTVLYCYTDPFLFPPGIRGFNWLLNQKPRERPEGEAVMASSPEMLQRLLWLCDLVGGLEHFSPWFPHQKYHM